jgi:hypothetical protein
MYIVVGDWLVFHHLTELVLSNEYFGVWVREKTGGNSRWWCEGN